MENQSWKRALYDFHVRCPHRHVGCDWTGELRNLLPHLNDNRQTPDLKGCPYTEITCPLCMAKVCHELFEDHQEEQCPQREYTCEYCKEYHATFEDVACRHWELCEQFLLPCPNNCIPAKYTRFPGIIPGFSVSSWYPGSIYNTIL